MRYFDKEHFEFTPKTDEEYLKVAYVFTTETITKEEFLKRFPEKRARKPLN
jgi:hypothetical protein